MKKIILLLIILGYFRVSAQNEYKFKESWYFAGGYGTSIFLGDIAPHPKLTFAKNSNDYELAILFRMGKRISPIFNVNIEVIKGNIKGHKAFDAIGTPMDLAFKGDYWGLTLNARIDIFKFFEGTRGLPFSFFVRIGGGPLYYRSVKTKLSTGDYLASMGMTNNGQDNAERVQTTVIPQGIGMYYDFSDNFRAEFETTLFNSFTDYLDAHHGQKSTSDDKIVIMNLGIQYTFDFDNWEVPKFKY